MVLALVVLLALAGAAAATPAVPGATFLVARALAEEGRYEEALELIGAAVTAQPADVYLRLERTDWLMRVGRLDEASAEARAARALAPENPDVLRVQGRVELARADRDDAAVEVAREAFERLREGSPEDLEALVSLGQLYLASGNTRLAADALAEASRLRPGHAGIESLLSRALESAGDPVQAERIQRERLRREPGALISRLELADQLAVQDRHAEAARLLEEAPPQQLATLDVRRRLALQRFLAGETDGALEVARGVVEQWPGYGGGRLLLARIELAFGHFAEALAAVEPLFTGEPLPEAVADLKVRILEGLGRIDEAAAQLESDRQRMIAAERGEEAARLALEIARLWARSGRWEQALAAAREAAASGFEEAAPEGALLAASALAELGRTDEALAALGGPDSSGTRFAARRISVLLDGDREAEAEAEIARLLAERPEADLAVAALLADREQFERAIPLLERARSRDPESLEAGFRLASAYERTGRLEDAVPLFRGLLERSPDFAPALNYLGYVWIDRAENLEEALAMVERAVRLDPDNGAYVDSLGWGYFRAGRFADAVSELERAARLMPDDATVLEHLGDACLAAGERGRAADAYRRAVHLSGDPSSTAARKLARLEGGS